MKAKLTPKNPKARAAGRTEGSQQRVVSCEQVRAAIDAEPELYGEMPDEIYNIMRIDKQAAADVMRASVRVIKHNIKTRLGL
jgi:hypothetical protein